MPRRTSIPPQPSPVIAAMQNLRPSGERSFEEFIARLLSKLSGERIRRCKAGSQGGVDAVAEVPFAIENKRYQTQLSTRDLLGGLSDAVITYPDLQLWMLAATCEVAAQTRAALMGASERQGVAVMILDATASETDLPGVGGLAALAATDIVFTMKVLADQTWREKNGVPDLGAIEAALHEIHRLPAFGSWQQHLRDDLRDLPTWHRLVRSQNEQLRLVILDAAANAFGTPYDESRAVSRSVEAELTAWAEACTGTPTCEIAVITGDRYDGKTTLVYRWLSQNLQNLPIPVFFLSSRAVQNAHGDVEGLVLREAQKALGTFAPRASSLIQRQRSRENGGAWCLIVLDGANEYVIDRQALSTAVLWEQPPNTHQLTTEMHEEGATSRHVQPDRERTKKRGRALLVTCRARDFEENASWLGNWPTKRVKLGPYDDEEFTDALTRRSHVLSDVADLPPSAAAMIRHPRYLDLMLRHRADLGQFSAITADVLHYLDASDKVPSHARLSAEAFKTFLAGLAAAWKEEERLNYAAILKQVRQVTADIDGSMATLLSDGVLTCEADGSFVPDRERLALGMGLFIRESLLNCPENVQAEKLNDIMEPHSDDDERVRWLRAAITTSVLVGDSQKHPATVDLLLTMWLTARNFSQHDFEDVKSLTPLLIEAILRILSKDFVHNGVLTIAQAMFETEMPRHKGAIGAVIRQWFRLVPTDSWHHDDGHDKAQRMAVVAADVSLHDLDLRLTAPGAGKSVRQRHRFGLSVACTNFLVEPIDLLSLTAARGMAHWNLDDGERFAIRMLLASAPLSWFEAEVQSWKTNADGSRGTFLRDLVRYSERADLDELRSTLPALLTFEWPEGLSQSELHELGDAQDAKETLSTATRAARLAVDPRCARPPRGWRSKFAKTAMERFGDSPKLNAGRSTTLDDLDLEHLEPALAAWAPVAGASIVRAFLTDIPRRVADGELSWSWGLEENATLLTRAELQRLLDLLPSPPPEESSLRHAWQVVYLCAMAAAPPGERLRLLLNHPFVDFEWTEFYEVLATTGNDELLRRTVKAVREECDPRRLKRARHLLANQGGWEPSTRDLARLIAHLSESDSDQDAQHATRTLLRFSRVDAATPAISLGELVHVTNSLSEAAWQYEAFRQTRHDTRPYGAEWIARARSAPLTARHNGAEGPDDETVVAAGIAHLASRVEERLAQNTSGLSEQLPGGIADAISDSAFESWVGLLLQSRNTWRVDAGVLVPVLRRAMKSNHPSAKELWALAYPFPRARVGFNERFVVQGIDWTLVDINDPGIDDGLARELLRELIIDCRSNSELVSIAIGARLESAVRLTTVLEALLDAGDENDRARARFIAGWMPEDELMRKRLHTADPSHWVNRIGENAIKRLDRECWAREWLCRFLKEKRRPQRWAAGRRFLACSDAATPFWADDTIRESQSPPPRRAEGVLLLGRIRKKVDDSELRDTFLGYSGRELDEVVPPWRKSLRWEDIDVTAHE
ncbi:MAG: hypothetical protein QOD64_2135 [Verrucomicrobiota bacterium]